MSMHIQKIGTLATVQDRGRIGYQSQGIPVGGAMDEDAWMLGNMLVGNETNQASLEIASGSLELTIDQDSIIALTGAGMTATCEGQLIPFNKRIEIGKGASIKFSPGSSGCWTYLSVAGGVNIEPVLGSRSTYLPANFGGFDGRPLKKADRVRFTSKRTVYLSNNQIFKSDKWGASAYRNNDPIRIFYGPEWEILTEQSRDSFLSHALSVSPDSNRMGYRLNGLLLQMLNRTELISTAVTRGTIQLTNDGTPIVLMADAQTIGGYPRIAQVAAVDLPRLAQTRPGETVRFKLISYDDACALFLSREQERKKTASAISLRLRIG